MTRRFQLDPRLEQDCFTLGHKDECQLLLMNNALVPWFIIVPETDATEMHQLPGGLRTAVENHIDSLSRFILEEFTVTSLNVAAIGNIVSQLHIHVIGRDPGDFCWPAVVWGQTGREPYTQARADEIKRVLRASLKLQ